MSSNLAPSGYNTVSPWVVTDDTVAFLDFVAEVFDGTERGRVQNEDGSIGHGEIRVGESVLLAFDRRSGWPVMPSLLRVFVADADATTAKAVAFGAHIVTEPADAAWGDRAGRIRDPFGNIWWIVAHVEDVPEDQMWERMSQPVYVDAMRAAQETLDAELSGGSTGRSSAPQRPAGTT